MTPSAIFSLPIQLATRLVLDDISYSNPLPPWLNLAGLKFTSREKVIADKIEKYLSGTRPKSVFEILIPNRSGIKKPWIVPSFNDQVILQTCVSALAERISRIVDSERVFSYRLYKDLGRLQFIHSQVRSWSMFQNETERRLRRWPVLLQLDIDSAFRSINRSAFLAFVEDLSPKKVVVDLLKVLLESFSPSERGLPLINHSVFFLGNAYLSVVDNVVRKHTANFIRFVDDYRVFGKERKNLEDTLERIANDLKEMGFKINVSKLKLGSRDEYLEAISKLKYTKAGLEGNGTYISQVIFDDIIEAKKMIQSIVNIVNNPEKYLNESFGRFILGALRKMRLNQDVARRRNYFSLPSIEFIELLSKNDKLINRMVDLLENYAYIGDESWRAVWLLYVMDDIEEEFIEDKSLIKRVKNTVKTIRASDKLPLIVRLWANKFLSDGPVWQGEILKEIDDLDYLEAGIRCYGGKNDL